MRFLPLIPLLLACTATSQASALKLTEVAKGFSEITDLQFVPGSPGLAVVLQKGGKASWVDLGSRRTGVFLELDVVTRSESGLLGLAFHPRFTENRKIYVDYVVEEGGRLQSRISEFTLPPGQPLGKATGERNLLTVAQPYANHNAGQLQFGPDGFLYIGFGDGGGGGDPHGNGQNPGTFLGKMLRIDPAGRDPGKPYAVPKDNPYIGRKGFLPEIWALGLRNPWRYSFDPRGRLVVADVGQNAWEEVDLVAAGDNLGWNHREGFHCFEPKEGCRTEGLVDPILDYPHELGNSITGGYVYLGSKIPALKGRYVFTDFFSGNLWSVQLPETRDRVEPKLHGKTGHMVATFGRDAAGELYLADYGNGAIYRLDGL